MWVSQFRRYLRSQYNGSAVFSWSGEHNSSWWQEMPEYGVCFLPVLLEGVICNHTLLQRGFAKRILPCRKTLEKQTLLLFLWGAFFSEAWIFRPGCSWPGKWELGEKRNHVQHMFCSISNRWGRIWFWLQGSRATTKLSVCCIWKALDWGTYPEPSFVVIWSWLQILNIILWWQITKDMYWNCCLTCFIHDC